MVDRLAVLLITCGLATGLFAAQSVYCPQNHGYINLGMSVDQVIAACGQPLGKQQSNKPAMQQVPVLQLLYNNQGSQTAFYGVWALPVGVNTGAQLQVNVINNKVSSIQLNGSNSNEFSICGDTSIQVGDPVTKVYNACGNPSTTNSTYTNQAIPSQQKPEIWVYQADAYQPPMRLTFVNGKLQSID